MCVQEVKGEAMISSVQKLSAALRIRYDPSQSNPVCCSAAAA